MNFIGAIQHATIGYGIRRRIWAARVLLHLQDHDLVWLEEPPSGNNVCELLGPDKFYHLQPEDITATDWETV